jgi:glutamate--cysteine ligase catalytic subunit
MPAKWVREFIHTHEEYKGDSVISDEICYKLLKEVKD